MKTRIHKWGNSLALRIPKSFASEVGLKNESAVDVSIENGSLLVAPIIKPELTLRQLLSKVTPENIQHEIESGPSTGNEIW